MITHLKKDIIKHQTELKPFLNGLYNCNDSQTLGCVAKIKTPSPKKPSPKTRKRCPKGTRKNKKTGNCDSISVLQKTHTPPPKPKTPSPKKPSPKTRKRCPKGTRKNKKTGNCDSISVLQKTHTPPPKPKTPSPKKPHPNEVILRIRDLLYDTISVGISEVIIHGTKYLNTENGILLKDKFRDGQVLLRDLIKLTKQEKEYKELIGHSLEYHIKKNLETVKETPESIYKKAQEMIQEVKKNPKKVDDAAFVKTFYELRKKLKMHQVKHGQINKYQEISSHNLKFFIKEKKMKLKTLKKKISSITGEKKNAEELFKTLNQIVDNNVRVESTSKSNSNLYDTIVIKKPGKKETELYEKTREELNSMFKDKTNDVFVKKYKHLSSVSLDDYLAKVIDLIYPLKRINGIIKMGLKEHPKLPVRTSFYEIYRKQINNSFTVEEPLFIRIFYPITQFSLEENIKKHLQVNDISTECNMTTICQYAGSCWFVTVFMILAKIIPLYNLLKHEHKTFVDGLLLCPRRNMGSYCKLPPPDIWKLYREKHRKHRSIHSYYDSKDSIKLDESFEKGGYSYILFKAIMQINKVYYLSYFTDFRYGHNIVSDINALLFTSKNACEWLMKHYKKGKGKTDYLNDVLMKYHGSKYQRTLQEIILKDEPWPTEESLKKGICYRTTISFIRNNKNQAGPNKMRVPEISAVPHRGKWKLARNWLSEVAKENPTFIGGWFNLKYPYAVKVGGVKHGAHATGFSVCRDDPANPTINICNTWGGTCSQGKHNPWGPQWESKKILLSELQIIQYLPRI